MLVQNQQAKGSHQILKFNAAGTPTGNFAVAPQNSGSDWIELGPDQCTMYYTSEGNAVKRFNVCTNTQLADFVTGPPGAACYALRLRPNGELMVACASGVVRLSSTGAILQTYPASGFTPAASVLFAMNLDPDGNTFWTGDLSSGQVYRINIGSGTQVTSFNASASPYLAGLAVVGELTGTRQPIPTLSEWAQIGMAALLVGGGLLALRKKGQVW